MRVDVKMSVQDHFIATTCIKEAMPTFMDGKVSLKVLGSAYDSKEGMLSFYVDREELGELLWAMNKCVDLWECGFPEHESCCDAYRSDRYEMLTGAIDRLGRSLDDYVGNIDYDCSDDIDDERNVACGPEYPRNDAGEWIGRM